MTQEEPLQPYVTKPSGGLNHIYRASTETPGLLYHSITSVKTRKQAERITEALNMAWAEGRRYERKHPG